MNLAQQLKEQALKIQKQSEQKELEYVINQCRLAANNGSMMTTINICEKDNHCVQLGNFEYIIEKLKEQGFEAYTSDRLLGMLIIGWGND